MPKSQRIEGNGKQILVMSESDYSALSGLLYAISENPDKIREISRDNRMGLGANHIESLSAMWQKLN